MSRPIQIHTHPFRYLLYLEWVLLVVATGFTALPAPFHRFPRLSALGVLGIAGFGLIGLRMPTGKLMDKILYTSLEIFVISLTVAAGGIRIFPFLLIVLVIRSCLIFDLPGRLTVSGLSFALFVFTLWRWFQNFPARPLLQERLRFILLGYALLFGLSLAFVLLLMNALLAERQSREKLAVANTQLRHYALQIEDIATLQERNRIAREIHDSLGHSLTALNLQLETALKLWQTNPLKAQMFLTEAKRLGSTALQEVRQSVSSLRATPLQGRSLGDAIASLAEDFYRTTTIQPNCDIQLHYPVPIEISTAIYRIAQEALTNICKYAAATAVDIQLQATPKDITLIIQDNGQGFDLIQNTTGFGLQGMRERTLALSGIFKIDSAPTFGCKITAHFPPPKF